MRTFLCLDHTAHTLQSYLFIYLGEPAGYEDLSQLVLGEAARGGEKVLQTCHLDVLLPTVSQHSPPESSIFV